MRPVGVVFGPKDPWAVFCFTPEPGFTVDPPILWRNKLIPDVEEPPHLWGGRDDAPYNDPGPASGATAPSAPEPARHPPHRSPMPRPTPPQCRTHPRPALPRTPEQRPPEGAEEPWTFAAPVRKGS